MLTAVKTAPGEVSQDKEISVTSRYLRGSSELRDLWSPQRESFAGEEEGVAIRIPYTAGEWKVTHGGGTRQKRGLRGPSCWGKRGRAISGQGREATQPQAMHQGG